MLHVLSHLQKRMQTSGHKNPFRIKGNGVEGHDLVLCNHIQRWIQDFPKGGEGANSA